MTARPGFVAAVRERRRHHRWPVEIFGRLVIGCTSHHARTIDLSLGGALVAAVEGAVPGTYGQLELPSLGSLRCRIVATTPLGCHLAFEHEGSPPVASPTSPVARRRRAGSVPPHGRAARNSSTPAL
jgi:methyl-accepting chemotaxis protein